MFTYKRNKSKYETIGKAFYNDKCVAIYGTINELVDKGFISCKKSDGWIVIWLDDNTEERNTEVFADKSECKKHIESFYFVV